MGLPLDVIGDKDRRSVRIKNEEMGRFWRNLIKPASTHTQTFLNRSNSDDKIGLAREFPLEAILEMMTDNARSKAGSKLKLEMQAGPEMLKQYRDIAIEEEQALHFDYVGFFNQCAVLMAEIKRLVNMKPAAGKRFGSLGMHNTESYDLVVMGLLRDINDVGGNRSNILRSVFAFAIIGAMEKLIRAGGNKFTEAAAKLSSKGSST
ncbi:hypothetical protein LTR37_004514 [Vermiconidia calcicola]|uniref:Uncharacterized protein n=1 Tax=Vermiconidia calcicola TaxID=1690605 RepID=A0ACC3NM14_9PEZI|nr:hypothetical protein LTR37_004514 [Vermiconidia calcicola]